METNSINDFKRNFAKIYHSEVSPKLKLIEKDRIKTRKKAFLFCGILLAAAITSGLYGYFYKIDILMVIGFIVLVGALFLYGTMQKNFETKLKQQIMPVLMNAFGNFLWTNIERIDTREIKESKIFSRFDKRDSDDNFFGTYRDMPIEISETHLYYETRDSKGHTTTHTTFKGALVSIGVGKNFTGHTVIRQRAFMLNRKVYDEVKLEDPEFGKKYFVDSNDQVEARFILTPAFMERFKHIAYSFGSSDPQCSFKDKKLLITLPTHKDLFALGDLNTPVTNTEPFQTLLGELIAIFEMIDHLKVTERTGL